LIPVLLVGSVVLAACAQRSTSASTPSPTFAGSLGTSAWCANVDEVRDRIRRVYNSAPNDGYWQSTLRRDVGDGLKEITGGSPTEIRADLLAVGSSQLLIDGLMDTRFDLAVALTAVKDSSATTSAQAGRLVTWLRKSCTG
jgi:hypothetical protein